MKRKGMAVILLCMLMLVGLGCRNNTMYSRVVSNDRYYLKLFPLNGIMGETYTLQAGDEIHVSIQKQEGKMDISVGIPGETPLYTGNDADTATFILSVLADGDYVISVIGQQARGELEFTIVRSH